MKEGWKFQKISDVCDVVNGGTPKTGVDEYWNGHHLWITPAEMGKLASPYVSATKRMLSDAGLANSSARLMPPNSIILSSRAPIGHLVINTKPMATNQGCKGLVPNKNLDYKYLYYFLSGNVDLLNSLGTGATFKELSATSLKDVRIPVPPIEEQRRIVAILDEAFVAIDTAIENTKKNIQNARELFDSYLNNVFSNPGPDWEKRTLNEVYDVRDGTHHSPKYHSTGFPLVTSKNLKKDGLSLDKVNLISKEDYDWINERSNVEHGDVLLAMIGTVGNPVLVNGRTDFAIKNVALFKVPENQNGAFLTYYLKSRQVIEKMEKEASGTTQKFVSLKYLRSFPINVPNNDRQKEIVAQLDNIDGLSKSLDSSSWSKIAELDELKKSILQKAFTGEL